ncbi:hypothetical protein Pla144_36780 [Bythopirellula polymerisocia]|uniref:Uncharacterized protein n=1 Tax=Bythopirellula polymerisocia TaxID=2528003 RepID=A0A5C6CK64_9BACT|nr:hypothetical protein Pla144_36780 [Bythopirellula polymerisocia]
MPILVAVGSMNTRNAAPMVTAVDSGTESFGFLKRYAPDRSRILEAVRKAWTTLIGISYQPSYNQFNEKLPYLIYFQRITKISDRWVKSRFGIIRSGYAF